MCPNRIAPISEKPTVLFVCVHNAGRSQTAAGFMGELSQGRVEVLSAGSEPSDRINPIGEVRPIRDEIRMRVERLLAELIPDNS